MMRLLIMAAQRDMLGRFVHAPSSARLEPVGVDLVPFALIRAVGQDEGLGLDEEGCGAEAIIDVGANVPNLCVHERGVARFVRIPPTGGRDVTVATADAAGVDQDQVEVLKRGQPVHAEPPFEVVRSFLEGRAAKLIDEIRSSLDFYSTQPPERPAVAGRKPHAGTSPGAGRHALARHDSKPRHRAAERWPCPPLGATC